MTGWFLLADIGVLMMIRLSGTGPSTMSVDVRSYDSVSPEDASTSTIAKIITEQMGRVRLGMAFKKKPKPDINRPESTDRDSNGEDTLFHTAIGTQSSTEQEPVAGPSSSWYVGLTHQGWYHSC
jgi:hypothetical protein